MSERRNEPRVPVCLEAALNGSGSRYNARVTDLSETGCYLDTMIDLVKDETVKVTILIAGQDSLTLAGRVAHQTLGLGFGVRFFDLDDGQLRRIRTLLRPEEGASNGEEAFRAADAHVDITSIHAM